LRGTVQKASKKNTRVFLIIVGLMLCVAFPEIILWLPGQMIL